MMVTVKLNLFYMEFAANTGCLGVNEFNEQAIRGNVLIEVYNLPEFLKYRAPK